MRDVNNVGDAMFMSVSVVHVSVRVHARVCVGVRVRVRAHVTQRKALFVSCTCTWVVRIATDTEGWRPA